MKIDLRTLGPPYLHIVVADRKVFSEYAYQTNSEERSLAVRVVRGSKMRRRQSLFDELSAALQFPLYFGENWDAVDELLADMEWLRADGYVLFVVETIQVLSEEPEEQFKIFAQVLFDTAKEWSNAQPPKPFHFLLQCTNQELDELQRRFQSTGVEPHVVVL